VEKLVREGRLSAALSDVHKYTFTQVQPVKTVRVDEEVWEKLMELRTKSRARSVNEVLRQLLGLAAASRRGAQPEPEPAQAAQPNPSSEAGRSRSGAAGNRPPPPAVGSPSPSAGAKAGAQPRKRGWTFCPQCLSMYDFQGKCPACGADLVPFGTEEGRRLYLKLKRERRAG